VKVFRFIQAEKATYDVKTMCRLLGVSRSGYYAWRARPPSARSIHDQELTERITLVHECSRRTYGAPRIWAELRDEGVRIGRKRVARLMRGAGIRGLCRHRKRRYAGPRALHPAGDLVRRGFRTSEPNLIWVADITGFPTAEGPLHVAGVMDLFSRALVGWSMASHLRAELVIDALEMAAARRRPEPGLIHHSDQGPQTGFKGSSQHRLVEQSIGAHRGPLRESASRASYVAVR
jgi:putative transposase